MFSDRFKIGFFASRVLFENCCKVEHFFVFGQMLDLFFVLSLSWSLLAQLEVLPVLCLTMHVTIVMV